MKRIQKELILKDLEKKIVLIVGPRQTGKTWVAKDIAQGYAKSVYLNYDQMLDREVMVKQSWLPTTDLLILDELHKMAGWKNYLKGVYDTKPSSMKILVTSSVRLDIYDQLGDSLAGRYFRHRLLPFSLAELSQIGKPTTLQHLMERSGFHEPYLDESAIEANRWRQQYTTSMLSSDIFEIDKIYNVKAMQLVFNLLRSRVGSPISYQSLAQDIAVSPTTIKKYIQILEALYIIFRVTPYSKNIARSLLKEPKLYFFDTGLVQGDEGAKLENFVAVSLLKHAYAKVDYQAQNYSLSYLRTKDGQEVDFALVNDDAIEKIIEVKLSDSSLSKPLLYFNQKYGYPAIQLVQFLRHEQELNGIQILDAQRFLENLFM